MSTFKQKLKEAKQLLSKTYDTTITYVVVCKPTDTYENAIEIFDTIEEASNMTSIGIESNTKIEILW